MKKVGFGMLAVMAWLAAALPAAAADVPTVSAQDRHEIVTAIAEKVEDEYVFPDIGKKMAQMLRSNLKKGKYDAFSDAQAFADAVSDDMIAVSNDKHVQVFYDPEPAAAAPGPAEPPLSEEEAEAARKARVERFIQIGHRQNNGFQEISNLAGNVGYLNLTNFWQPYFGGETAWAAMTLLANTDALILDLRENGGGHGGMVIVLAAYLINSYDRTLLFKSFSRQDGPDLSYNSDFVPGKLYPKDSPIFVLIGPKTFSAAEALAYVLKTFRGATLVGETTRGGGNSGNFFRLGPLFSVFIPDSSVAAADGFSWEGKGIEPNVKVAAKDAFDAAYGMALEVLIEKFKDDAEWLAELRAARDQIANAYQASK